MDKNAIELSTYERLLIIWENSKELVRDYEMHSKRVDEPEVSNLLKELAENEGHNASKLHDMVVKFKN